MPTRLGAIAILGIEGALLSLLFALYGAPDLAFTQLMIEVVTLVLFVLAFHFLPNTFRTRIPRRTQLFDISFAAAAGLVVTLLILAANANPIADSISAYYVENAEAVAHGHNVVNVILVDFRGLDTQGEILVLIIAAIGVTALLRLRPSDQPRGQNVSADETSIVLPVNADARIEVEKLAMTSVHFLSLSAPGNMPVLILSFRCYYSCVGSVEPGRRFRRWSGGLGQYCADDTRLRRARGSGAPAYRLFSAPCITDWRWPSVPGSSDWVIGTAFQDAVLVGRRLVWWIGRIEVQYAAVARYRGVHRRLRRHIFHCHEYGQLKGKPEDH